MALRAGWIVFRVKIIGRIVFWVSLVTLNERWGCGAWSIYSCCCRPGWLIYYLTYLILELILFCCYHIWRNFHQKTGLRMVLARRVGAETQLQRVTAGWWNQLIEKQWTVQFWSYDWSVKSPPTMFSYWRLVFVTFGCVTLPRRFRLGIVFGGEVWRSSTCRQILLTCAWVPGGFCCELLAYWLLLWVLYVWSILDRCIVHM